eukprot:gene10227-2647_t
MNKILIIILMFVGTYFCSTGAKYVSAIAPGKRTKNRTLAKPKTAYKCYLPVKSGYYSGYPSQNIIPKQPNLGYKAGEKNAYTKVCVKQETRLSRRCTSIIKELKRENHPWAIKLDLLIKNQNSNKYQVFIPTSRKCVRKTWWRCTKYKTVQKKVKAFPFKKYQKEIGSSNSLEEEEEEDFFEFE